jgi:hypothetical protein
MNRNSRKKDNIDFFEININLLIRIQRYLKLYEDANLHFFPVIEDALETLKNFLEGPYKRNQDVLSRSKLLRLLQKIMFY